jgi:Ca2+:H+ antiporter
MLGRLASRLSWDLLLPLAACALLGLVWGQPAGVPLQMLVAVALVAAVVCGVHHAEAVALRVGEPFGTLVLALAVTVIELGLIGSLMVSGGSAAATLPRDTLFATVMIVCNGLVGACLAVGAWRHHVLAFRVEGAGHALVALAPMVILTLVLPNYTLSTPGPTYAPAQLAFAGIASLALYGVFVFAQTVRHRDYFLPLAEGAAGAEPDVHAAFATTRPTWAAALLMLLSLVAVVGLAKQLAPVIEGAVLAWQAPPSTVGLIVAMIVLAPESVAALRAAARNRMQTSLNLALGSALASIGLTIPAVAVLSVQLGVPLQLGLAPAQGVLLALTLLISVITLAGGRATVLHGAVHLVVFAAFLVLAFVP